MYLEKPQRAAVPPRIARTLAGGKGALYINSDDNKPNSKELQHVLDKLYY
jgi:hypothetical protein